MNDEFTHKLSSSLANLEKHSLKAGVAGLLEVLGYKSKRTARIGGVEDFLNRFANNCNLTEKQSDLFTSWDGVEIVCQFSEGEFVQRSESGDYDQGRNESFLFIAVDLKMNSYTRMYLAETSRTVNRLFAMPVILFFRCNSTLTLAATHRRAHKRDDNRDVLNKVTLVKDIRLDNPHRAHIEILSDLSFQRLAKSGVTSFDELHIKWEETLDIEMLNERFYCELFGWFNRAVYQCQFPDDGEGEGCTKRHVIRLITRLLFIWFLKEKNLIPEALFEKEFADATLKNNSPERTDYYRAILQNLFFATLNTEINERGFIDHEDHHHLNLNKYHYRDMLRDPDFFVNCLNKVPFVNGGLFDCLDFATDSGNGNIDAFSDDPLNNSELRVPSNLFFDEKGLFEIFRSYKFTIEESTPLDCEVALDPELLGRVFENLLAYYNQNTRESARKDTGSYYTPRPVVEYMVRETLVEALMSVMSNSIEDKTEFERKRIERLFDYSSVINDINELFNEEERHAIVSAIAKIKILDPAVGSGAFPMGILQILTMALRRLDSNNMLWMSIQIKLVDLQAKETLREISNTFKNNCNSDYVRKLYLIQNGIYGVDNQTIACQIAKLRFYISLIIEQKPDFKLHNRGIRPLPNLEVKIIAADSLLDLNCEFTDLLNVDDWTPYLKQINKVRQQFFLAENREKKLKYKRKENNIRDQLQKILEIKSKEYQEQFEAKKFDIEKEAVESENSNIANKIKEIKLSKLYQYQPESDKFFEAARMITKWDFYNQNSPANWFNAKYMFGINNGFDIIIGNPPYIQLQRYGGFAGKLYGNSGFETFQKTGDIYQLFIERGCNLLRPHKGVLAFITSNSWLKAEYGQKLRGWLTKHHSPLQLIEMGKNVFKNAIVDSSVLIIKNGKMRKTICNTVDIEEQLHDKFPPSKENWGTLKPKGKKPWLILSKVEQKVMDKMEAVGTPLKDWDISIYRGILTGYNAAFIVNQTTRDALIEKDFKSSELLKPILRGRDIKRYRAIWAGLWLIDTHNGYSGTPPINIKNYPAIKAHLDKFIDNLQRRQDQGVTPYNLRNCAYHEEFEKTKLFWMHMTPYVRFALVEPKVVCNQKCFIITGKKLEFLCALLNSSLVSWFVKRTSVTTGMGLAQWDKFTVECVPIIITNESIIKQIEDKFHSIIIAIESGESNEIKNLCQMLDSYIFNLYGLTKNEILEILKLIKN